MEANEPSEANKKSPWRGPNQSTYQDPNPQSFVQNHPWNYQPSYPPWGSQKPQKSPWNQGCRGKFYGNTFQSKN